LGNDFRKKNVYALIMALSRFEVSVVTEIHVTPNILANFSYLKVVNNGGVAEVSSYPAYWNSQFLTPAMVAAYPVNHFIDAVTAGIPVGTKGLDLSNGSLLANSVPLFAEIVDTLQANFPEYDFFNSLGATQKIQYAEELDMTFLMSNTTIASIL
jgi:hypothetical protein